ncbi:MAG: penicillin-binding transpeptidase domain-containing protein [Clostridia bacterium]|nr:penicillin-binding transpeptidase domain-containing protein [Clostridia bacterium]
MNNRYKILYIVLAVVSVVIFIRLCSLTLVYGSEYAEQSEKRRTRSVSVEAPRGEIYDRFGRTIVTNRMTFSVKIQKLRQSTDEDINATIKNLHKLFSQHGVLITDTFPVEYENLQYVFVFDESSDNAGAKEQAWKEKYGYAPEATPQDVTDGFARKYAIEEQDAQMRLAMVSTRFEMEFRDFSANTDFTFASDADMNIVTAIKEAYSNYRGVNIETAPTRSYPYGTLAAHLLGRVGKVSSEEYAEQKDNGYSINSLIGKQGIEKYLESYLRGENGVNTVDQTIEGKSIDITQAKAAKSGANATLTIDLDLQQCADRVLENTIRNLRVFGTDADSGAYADAGSVVVMDVSNGDILAMSSYPTYNPATFNASYTALLRNSARPLLNRAVAGLYSPGSTFKMLMTVAGLEENAITADEYIVDGGVYRYYNDYQPACWIWRQYGYTHGAETVAQALRDSCNYFFYEVGRRLTIDKIGAYAAKFGFGSITGVELPGEERSGIVAGPEERAEKNQPWYPGDVLQTAIGQSDTTATPLQLAAYVSAIANGGTYYKPHLVRNVKNSDGQTLYATEPVIGSYIAMSDSTKHAVHSGMRMVVTEGTAKSAFAGCDISVAAKTGSAQLGNGMTNGVYVAYAPYDNPQIAVAAVVEKCGGAGNVANIVREIIECYFSAETENNAASQNNVLLR